jgi:hypothetical protein
MQRQKIFKGSSHITLQCYVTVQKKELFTTYSKTSSKNIFSDKYFLQILIFFLYGVQCARSGIRRKFDTEWSTNIQDL